MYGDRLLEFVVAGRDNPAIETRALPMGQGDLAGSTDGMGPYAGLFVVVTAGEDVPAGFSVTMLHADARNGSYSPVFTTASTTAQATAGKPVFSFPVPAGIKNWVKFTLSSAKIVTIALVRDADKPHNGLLRV